MTADTLARAERRRKIVAMAQQTASPAEAEVARAMLSSSPEGQLDVIAQRIRDEWGRGIEVEFEIGRLLSEAAAILNPNARNKQAGVQGSVKGSPFGDWVRAQNFPFSGSTAYNLRIGYERKEEVLAFLEARSQSSASQRSMGVNTAVERMNAKPKRPETLEKRETTAADPAYAALRDAVFRIIGTDEEPINAFEKMHVDDLTKCAGFIKRLALAYNEAKAKR